MRKRQSYETGHRPKLLVVVDETHEADRALYFATRRAARVGAGLITLHVIPAGENQVWLGVEDIMRAEAEEKSAALLAAAADRARQIASIETEQVSKHGLTSQEIIHLIESDEDISSLILAAGTGHEGPGPLVSSIAKGAAEFSIPVTIVPGGLSDEEIDAIAG
jgi:nucleotide-binding universal stress UspA family protein